MFTLTCGIKKYWKHYIFYLFLFNSFHTAFCILSQPIELMTRSQFRHPHIFKKAEIIDLKWTEDNTYLAAVIKYENFEGEKIASSLLIWSKYDVEQLLKNSDQTIQPLQLYHEANDDRINSIAWIKNSNSTYFLIAGTELNTTHIFTIERINSTSHIKYSKLINAPFGNIKNVACSKDGNFLLLGIEQPIGQIVVSYLAFVTQFTLMMQESNPNIHIALSKAIYYSGITKNGINIHPVFDLIAITTNDGNIFIYNSWDELLNAENMIKSPTSNMLFNIVKWHPFEKILSVAQVNALTPNIINLKVFNNTGTLLSTCDIISRNETISNLSITWLNSIKILIMHNDTQNRRPQGFCIYTFDTSSKNLVQYRNFPSIYMSCITSQAFPNFSDDDFANYITIGTSDGYVYRFKII